MCLILERRAYGKWWYQGVNNKESKGKTGKEGEQKSGSDNKLVTVWY